MLYYCHRDKAGQPFHCHTSGLPIPSFYRAGYPVITQSRLKELLHYNEETGVFTWKVRCGARALAGNTAGSKTSEGYSGIHVKGKSYLSHRLAWVYTYGYFPKEEVDHINGDRSDNRILNLREATRTQNNQNLRKCQKNSSSGILGVYPEGKKFKAVIGFGGKLVYLGMFETAVLAHEAYLIAKRELHSTCTI